MSVKAKSPRPAKKTSSSSEASLLENWRIDRSPATADAICATPLIVPFPTKALAALAVLAKLPDDPRSTVILIALLRAAKYPGSSSKRFWTKVFAKLVDLKDARAVPVLEELAAKPPLFLGAAFTEWCTEQIAEAAKNVRDASPAEPAASKYLAAKGAGAEGADELIAKVWAAPEDIALRAVIGDALLELEDPWGELIAMQTAKKPDEAAIKKFVKKHGGRLSGGINHVANRDNMIFEHGFLVEVEIGRDMVGRRYWEDCALAPHWATVRAVTIGYSVPPKWWFPFWFEKGKIGMLRTLVLRGGLTLVRASATSPWKFAKDPGAVDARALMALESIFPTFATSVLEKWQSSNTVIRTLIREILDDRDA